jgi:predicted amidohydrolase YtcJ
MTDCHHHSFWAGLADRAVQLKSLPDVKAVLDALVRRAEKTPSGEWVWGVRLDYDTLAEMRYPSLAEMDQALPDHPLMITTTSGHAALCNRLAFEKTALSSDMPQIKSAFEAGRFTGLFPTSPARRFFNKRVLSSLSDEEMESSLREVSQKALEVGLTELHVLIGMHTDNDREVEILLAIRDSLPIRTTVFYQGYDSDKAVAWGLPRIGGCILVDGATGERTAAYTQPYSDKPSTSGLLYHSDDELEAFLRPAHERGLQTAVHAIGDRAIEQVLRIHEKISKDSPYRDCRHRIEHFSLAYPDQIKRAADLGIIISTQPILPYYNYTYAGQSFIHRLGEDRARQYFPLRQILEAGLTVCSGTDCPVRPMDPLHNIQAAVNHHNPEERLTALEALALGTSNAAKSVFKETVTGMIKPGLAADLTILEDDPLTCQPDEINGIQVTGVVVCGEVHPNPCYKAVLN